MRKTDVKIKVLIISFITISGEIIIMKNRKIDRGNGHWDSQI